jgi:hypothetical protein
MHCKSIAPSPTAAWLTESANGSIAARSPRRGSVLAIRVPIIKIS